MDWRNRVVAHLDVLVGKPVIKGTRICVELVMDLLAAGYTTEQIIEQYDHLTRQDIQACLAYAKEVIQTEGVYAVKLALRDAFLSNENIPGRTRRAHGASSWNQLLLHMS